MLILRFSRDVCVCVCLQGIVANNVFRGMKSVLTKALSCLLCGYCLSDSDFDRKFRLENALPTLSRCVAPLGVWSCVSVHVACLCLLLVYVKRVRSCCYACAFL